MEVLDTANRQDKKIKVIQIGKEEAKLSLFADDMIVYTEYPIDSTKNQHDLISEFGKQQLQSQYSEIKGIFYTNNKILEAEIMKKSHLI